ncbi:MAG: hypothetical protein Q7J69_02195, partial [Candidatus Omnitrophota bacterium]|nr:hypothetical protein [Candidatus Omnitrophota bacterium]
AYTFFAFLQEQVGLFDIAEAVPLPDKYFGSGQLTPEQKFQLLTCPVDEKTDRGKSYGFPAGVGNQPLSWLLDSRNAGAVLITEVAGPNGTAFRHEGGRTSVTISVVGIVERTRGGGTPSNVLVD